jgi:hypothetical protein
MVALHLGEQTKFFAVVFRQTDEALAFRNFNAKTVAEVGNGLAMKGDRLTSQLIEFYFTELLAKEND